MNERLEKFEQWFKREMEVCPECPCCWVDTNDNEHLDWCPGFYILPEPNTTERGISMNSTDNQEAPVWRWHRQDKKHKSHLTNWKGSVWDSPTACGLYGFSVNPEQANNSLEDPCKRCLRASAGLKVGKG